jgi:hypothetical protein
MAILLHGKEKSQGRYPFHFGIAQQARGHHPLEFIKHKKDYLHEAVFFALKVSMNNSDQFIY